MEPPHDEKRFTLLQRSSSEAGGGGKPRGSSRKTETDRRRSTVPALNDVLRVPIWGFVPSAAQFRYVMEWCLLSSKKLMRTLPASLREILRTEKRKGKTSGTTSGSSSETSGRPPSGEGASSEGADDLATAGAGQQAVSEHARRRGRGKKQILPPSPLDLADAFSSHYIQVCPEKYLGWGCDSVNK